MFRDIRRKDRQADVIITDRLLKDGEYGILSTTDENGYAYATPLNYVYSNDKIYFHCAVEGHKLDNIKNNNQICFCVVGKTNVLSSKFSTAYESVIAFGKAYIIEEENEKTEALKALVYKYSPDFIKEGLAYIERAINSTAVVRIDIEKITSKNRQG